MALNSTFFIFLLTFSVALACRRWNYVKTKGYRTSTDWEVRLMVKDVRECMDLCSNENVCQTFDFDEKTKFCYLFSKLLEVKNNTTRVENDNFSQYEKICFKDDKSSLKCDKPLIRAPQKVLIGVANTVTTAAKFEDCVQDCVGSERLYGFTCLSGMFYSAEPSTNCVLNIETSKSHPDYFYEENLDEVDYFEFDCDVTESKKLLSKRAISDLQKPRHRSVLWPNSADWGSWTRCDGSVGTRSRYRQCKTVNPNSCQKDSGSCDPTNRMQEMQDIMNEETGGGNSQNGGNGNQIQPVTNPNSIIDNGGGVPLPNGGGTGGMVQPNGGGTGGMVQPNGGPVQPPTDGGMVAPTPTRPTDPGMGSATPPTFIGGSGSPATILIQMSTLPPGSNNSGMPISGSNGPNFIFVQNQPPNSSSNNGMSKNVQSDSPQQNGSIPNSTQQKTNNSSNGHSNNKTIH